MMPTSVIGHAPETKRVAACRQSTAYRTRSASGRPLPYTTAHDFGEWLPSEVVALSSRDGVEVPVERVGLWLRRNAIGTSVYRLGSDRGSPNHGSTVFSKRVIAQISSPARVRTKSPTPWLMPVESRT